MSRLAAIRIDGEMATLPEQTLTFEILRWAILLSAVGIAAVTDLRTRRIPNWLTFPLALSGLFAAALVGGWGWSGLLDSVAGMFCLGFPYLLIYALGGGGAGDTKLMMGLGTWAGVDLGIYLVVGVMVTGLIYAFVYAGLRGEAKALLYSVLLEVVRLVRGRKSSSATLSDASIMMSESEGGADLQQASPDSASTCDDQQGSSLVCAYGPVIAAGVVFGGIAWFLT